MEQLVEALIACRTQQDIRKIYKQGCLHLHPDKVAPDKRYAAEIAFKAFLEIVDAARCGLVESGSAPSSGSTSPMSVD